MIPFATQRGNGADLAVHLGNAYDNEQVIIDEIRGVLADDLPGAFSEMEAKAHALTNMTKPFYSLAMNPDPNQPWSKDMYYEYRDRAEDMLGLVGHDRVTVFHIKEGQDGHLREHCHVVWNRTDVDNQCGVNIAYDRLKLMSLTREFAQEQDLTLPDGYYKINDNHEQTSLHESVKEKQTGISKEEHKSVVTDLWRTSDGAKAFVASLEDHGYMLAQGDRPYVLVDTFGKMHALPRLIDDRSVRTKDVEAYLQTDFPSDQLSTVDEAREVAAQHQDSRARVEESQKLQEQREALLHDQDLRRQQLQQEVQVQQAALEAEQARLSNQHKDALYVHQLGVAQQDLDIQFRRAAYAPTGLAAFLSRVTGIDKIREHYHAYQDDRRDREHERQRQEIEARNEAERIAQAQRHELESLEMQRREAEQAKAFEREQRTLALVKERETVSHHSKDHVHMPPVSEIENTRSLSEGRDRPDIQTDFARAAEPTYSLDDSVGESIAIGHELDTGRTR